MLSLNFLIRNLSIYGFYFLVNGLVEPSHIVVYPIIVVLRQNWIPEGAFIFVHLFEKSDLRMHVLGAFLSDFGANSAYFCASEGILG